jgi:autotransporter-associated beta strand protein
MNTSRIRVRPHWLIAWSAAAAIAGAAHPAQASLSFVITGTNGSTNLTVPNSGGSFPLILYALVQDSNGTTDPAGFDGVAQILGGVDISGGLVRSGNAFFAHSGSIATVTYQQYWQAESTAVQLWGSSSSGTIGIGASSSAVATSVNSTIFVGQTGVWAPGITDLASLGNTTTWSSDQYTYATLAGYSNYTAIPMAQFTVSFSGRLPAGQSARLGYIPGSSGNGANMWVEDPSETGNWIVYNANGNGTETGGVNVGIMNGLLDAITFSTTGGPITWTGSASSTWDTATANFKTAGGLGAKYSNSSNVIFDDTASQFQVNLAAAVSPSSVSFSNSGHAYTLTGAAISGSGSVVLNGTSIVNFDNANTYSGATTINAGVLAAGASNAFSPNSSVTANGGTLNTGGYAQTIKSLSMASAALNLQFGHLFTCSGSAQLAGTLNLSSVTGTGELMAYASESGTFSNVTGLPFWDHLVYTPTQLDIVPNVNATTYTLAASASALTIHVGGNSTIIATITNTGTGSADTLNYTNLTVTNAGQLSGTWPKAANASPLANGGGSDSNSGAITASTPAGSYTFTPSVATATNATLGDAATLQTTTSVSVNVFSGQAQWNLLGGGNWSPDGNWSDTQGSGSPGAPGVHGFAGDTATFGNAIAGGSASIALDKPVTLSGMAFSNTAGGSYALSGGGSNTLTLNNSGSGVTISAASGSNVVNAPLILAGNLAVAGAGNLVFGDSSSITDNGGGYSLAAAGPGTLTLAGNVTLAGTVSVSGGAVNQTSGSVQAAAGNIAGGAYSLGGNGLLSWSSLYIGNSGSGSFVQTGGTHTLSSGLILGNNLADSGTYNLQGGLLFTPSEVIGYSGSGSFTQVGGTHTVTGSLVLGQNAGAAGTYNLNGGLLILGGSLSQGSGAAAFNFGGGTLGAFAPLFSTVNMNLNGLGTIDTTGGNINFEGLLGGSGGLTKVGPGTLTIGGSNSYLGGTTIDAGAVQVGNNSALGATTAPLWINGGAFDVHGFSISVGALSGQGTIDNLAGNGSLTGLTAGVGNASSTFAGTIQNTIGQLSLTKLGSGALTLSGSNSYIGGTTINAGTLFFTTPSAVAGPAASIVTNSGAVAATGYPMDQNFVNQLAATSGGVAALAANSGNNLSLSGFSALRLGALGNATYSGTLAPNATTYRLGGGGGTLTITGPLGGAYGVDVGDNGTPPGAVILAGSNSYSGPTQVSGGTLVLLADNASSSFTANNGGTLLFDGATVNLGTRSIQATAGGSVQYLSTLVNGGFLFGPGTHIFPAGFSSTLNATTINPGTAIQENGADVFTDVTNRGNLTNNGYLTIFGGVNDVGGSLTVNGTANVSAWGNGNAGVITVNNGGLLNNSLSNLVSGGGGQIYVNSGGTLNADSANQGVTLDLYDSLLVNNGTIMGATNVYYGATVEGTGRFGAINLCEGGSIVIAGSSCPTAASLVISGGTISGGGQTVQSATILAADTLVAAPSDLLVLTGNLTGEGALTKLGAGTLILTGSNTYQGGTIVSAGTLEAGGPAALPGGTSLIVGAGGQSLFGSPPGEEPAAASSALHAAGVEAVPEPGTLVLITTAGVIALAAHGACCRRKKK